MPSDPHKPSLSQADLRRNMRLNTWGGACAATVQSMVQPFLGILALRLGATNWELGLLASLPALASILVLLPASIAMRHARQLPRTTAGLTLAARLGILGLAMVPAFGGRSAPLWLALIIGLMNLPGSVSVVAWQALVAEAIPAPWRAKAFARRNAWMGAIGTAVSLASGWLIDRLGMPRGYELVFSAAFAVSILEVNTILLLTPASHTAGRPARWASGHLLQGHAFAAYTLASVLWYIAWQAPWPLFTKYQVSVLGADNTWIGLLNLANTATTVLAYPFWAEIAERLGNRVALGLACGGLAAAPVFYAVARSLPELTAFNAITGVFAAGVLLLLFNAMLETAPAGVRTEALALYNTLVNAAAAAAPLLGVWGLERLGYAASFWCDGALRVVAAGLFLITSRSSA